MRRGLLLAGTFSVGLWVGSNGDWLTRHAPRSSVLEHFSLGYRPLSPYPVVLCHGLSGWATDGRIEQLQYFRLVPEFLEQAGVAVITPQVDPFASLETRGQQLAAQIQLYVKHMRQEYGPNVRVNVIGHSAGGLDARVASHLLHDNEIASITTIATPHHGSSLALNLRNLPESLRLFGQLNPEQMKQFNQRYPDLCGISYFSVAGVQKLAPTHPLYLSQKILEAASADDVPNDGLVSLPSAKHGTFLGQVPLNHWSQIGWFGATSDAHLLLYAQILWNLKESKL